MEDKSSQDGFAWRFVPFCFDENPPFGGENALTWESSPDVHKTNSSAMQNIPFMDK
jgi:hypothetical protein